MPAHRLPSRLEYNIHFTNSENDEIGGAYQGGSLTWAGMSKWMHIVYELPSPAYAPFRCLEDGDPKDPIHHHGPRINMPGNIDLISPGFYVLLGPAGEPIEIPVNQQMPLPRALSRSLSGPSNRCNEKFRDRVRDRDGRCVITSLAVRDFTALHAVHIFPIAHLGLQQQITDDDVDIGESGINSIQNGILLDASTHEFFDKYMVAINPDDDYKVVCFINEPQYQGLTMIRPDVSAKYQPCDALLRERFRMAVLLNMKGREGFPEWDEDITEGCDDVAEISASEEGKLRFETVLAGKLNNSLA